MDTSLILSRYIRTKARDTMDSQIIKIPASHHGAYKQSSLQELSETSRGSY